MKLKDLKEKLIKEDKKFRDNYLKENLSFGISRLIANVRTYEKIDQMKLAKLVDTKQSGISRLERGNSLPSLSFLNKIVNSLNYRIKITFISKKTGVIFDSDGVVDLNVYTNVAKSENYKLTADTSSIQSKYFPVCNKNGDLVLAV